MSTVRLSDVLEGRTTLWRYMALDKFIDVLSMQHLFFCPLAFYIKSDPYEGYLPAVCLQANTDIFKSLLDKLPPIDILRWLCSDAGQEPTRKALEEAERMIEDLKHAPRKYFLPIRQCVTVSCWHANEYESEAMWRLYSESGKAVAIETTVDALKAAIEARESEHLVHIHRVKYVDFFDRSLRPADCVVGGHLVPLLKRKSYEHENEVRAFIGRRTPGNPRDMLNLDYWRPTAIKLPVDVRLLIKRVHVSPYQSDPFESSVTKICEAFGLGADIVQPSRLLRGQEELLNLLDV
jgi:hypothetical protein